MRKEVVLPDRLGGERVVTLVPVTIYQSDRVQMKTEPREETLLLPLGKRRRLTDRLSQPAKLLRLKQEEEERPLRTDWRDADASSIPQVAESSLHAALHQSVFLSAMSPQPGRDLSLCWEQHRKLLPGVSGVQAEAVQKWSIQQVADFVHSLPGCEDQAELFRAEQIDGRAFLLLTQRDIVRIMSIKLGPALKIYNSILMFKHSEDGSQPQVEDESQSQAEDESQSQADGSQSQEEDGSQPQAEDESQSQADGSQSQEEDGSQPKPKNGSQSQVEDRSQSQAKNGSQPQTEDKSQAQAEDKSQAQAEDESQSQAEDMSQSQAEDGSHSQEEHSNT